MSEFKKFLAVWLSIVILGTILTAETLRMLSNQKEQVDQSNASTQGSNHFSVQWMGFFPSYSSQYPEYYICVNNLKSDILAMDIALQIKNQEDAGYYFKGDKYEEPPTGWTISPIAIGFVDVDQTKTFTYSVSRSKPASISQGRLTETINLVIGAYHDSSYLNLYSQDNFTVTFNFIDRTSSAWTLLYHDTFDGGTTQGWSGTNAQVSSDYYRSFPYSLKIGGQTGYSQYSKTFNVGLGEEHYLIFSLRSGAWGSGLPSVGVASVICFQPDVTPSKNTWYQFAVPLPLGESAVWMNVINAPYPEQISYAYLDDVFVIAK